MGGRVTPAETLKREQAKAARERLELALLQQIRAARIDEPSRQYKFHAKRRWAFDFAWTDLDPHFNAIPGVAVEVDGGTWSGGRHTRGAGYEKDCEKLNEAVCLGWRVIRVTGAHIKSGKAIEWIQRALGDRL